MKTRENKISSCLWFDGQAEEAANFYTSVFKNSKIDRTIHYPDLGQEVPGGKAGNVMTVEFEIEDFKFMGLNAGPLFKFNPSISFFVNCESKEEVDELWEKLSKGGKALMPLDKYDFAEHYGWIQDKYGLSWQLIFADKPEGDWRPKIIPCLLFTNEKSGKTKKALDYYVSVFDDSKIGLVAPNDKPGTEGTTAFADFMLENTWFAAMDSPNKSDFGFNEAISFFVHCETQKEIDYYFEKLSAMPESEQCGWLKDKYGVSWQIIPKNIMHLVNSKEGMQAMMQMKKLDIAKLELANQK